MNTELSQLHTILTYLLGKHRDRVTTHVLFNGRWEFYSRHEGADATYVCIMGWKASDRDGGKTIIELRSFFDRTEMSVGDYEDTESHEACLRCMPAIERWLYVEDDEIDEEDDDDEDPEVDDVE